MKSDRLAAVCGCGVIVSVFFFLVTCWLNIQNGYARDERIYVPELLSDGLWVFLAFCSISFLIFSILSKRQSSKMTHLFSCFLLTVLIVSGLSVSLSWFISYSRAKSLDDTGMPQVAAAYTSEKMYEILPDGERQLVAPDADSPASEEELIWKREKQKALASWSARQFALELSQIKVVFFEAEREGVSQGALACSVMFNTEQEIQAESLTPLVDKIIETVEGTNFMYTISKEDIMIMNRKGALLYPF